MKIYGRVWRAADQARVLEPFEISAPLFYPPDRPACTPRALRVPVGIVLCLPSGQLTGALIEYVVKHSARHYFTVIAGTPRLLQVLIIRRTRKRI